MVLEVKKVSIFIVLVMIMQVSPDRLRNPVQPREGCYYSGVDSVCWEVDDYPTETIENKLASTSDVGLAEAFGETKKSTPVKFLYEPCSLCNTTFTFRITPRLLNMADQKCYVVNTDKYHQSIVYNVCNREQQNSNCMKMETALGIEPRCEQKTTMIRLLCYNPDTVKFEAWAWYFPSSCVCTLKTISEYTYDDN